jgi:hypothetical protein
LALVSRWRLFITRCGWRKKLHCSTNLPKAALTGVRGGALIRRSTRRSAWRRKTVTQNSAKAWEDGSFSHKGKYFEYEDIEVLPKPYQKDMPVWIGATSEGSIEWAAQKGL